MDYLSMGQCIKQQRLIMNLTQEKLSEKVNVSPTYLSLIECGKKRPSLETLSRISDVLCIGMDDLLNDRNFYKRNEKYQELLQALKGLGLKEIDEIINLAKDLSA